MTESPDDSPSDQTEEGFSKEEERQRRKVEKLRWITMVAATVATVGAGALFAFNMTRTSDATESVMAQIAALEMTATENDSLREALQRARDRVDSLATGAVRDSPRASDPLGDRVARLQRQVEENKDAVERFEKLMVSDAERLVTLPRLRQEIESTNSEIRSVRRSIGALRNLIEETNTQNRWLVGTVIFGLAAVVIRLFTPLLREK